VPAAWQTPGWLLLALERAHGHVHVHAYALCVHVCACSRVRVYSSMHGAQNILYNYWKFALCDLCMVMFRCSAICFVVFVKRLFVLVLLTFDYTCMFSENCAFVLLSLPLVSHRRPPPCPSQASRILRHYPLPPPPIHSFDGRIIP
jgi:hypothetical protein